MFPYDLLFRLRDHNAHQLRELENSIQQAWPYNISNDIDKSHYLKINNQHQIFVDWMYRIQLSALELNCIIYVENCRKDLEDFDAVSSCQVAIQLLPRTSAAKKWRKKSSSFFGKQVASISQMPAGHSNPLSCFPLKFPLKEYLCEPGAHGLLCPLQVRIPSSKLTQSVTS